MSACRATAGSERLGPRAANQDRELAHGRRNQCGEPILDADEALVEQIEAGAEGAEVVTVSGVVLFVPSGAQAKDDPTAADVVGRCAPCRRAGPRCGKPTPVTRSPISACEVISPHDASAVQPSKLATSGCSSNMTGLPSTMPFIAGRWEVVVAEDHVDAEVVGGQNRVSPRAVVERAAGLDLYGDADGTGHECS